MKPATRERKSPLANRSKAGQSRAGRSSRKWFILSAVGCGTFMATLDASIVNVALPSITENLQTGLSHSRWVVISYLFAITGTLLFFGKMSDLLNRKVFFMLGFITFSLGSLLCALAVSIQELVAFRAFQGLGAAMLMSNGPAIITAAFPSNERGGALGILSMAVSVGLALGPTLGGLLVGFFSWQSIFLVNIPIGLLGSILVFKFVPSGHGMPASDPDLKQREASLPLMAKIQIYLTRIRDFDWVGMFIWTIVQFGFVFAIDRENILGFAGPAQRILSFGSIGLFVLFLIWEESCKEPILNLSLFRSRLFLTSNFSTFFSSVAISSITLLMPFYFQNIRHLAPHEVGLLMTAIPATTFCFAPFSGKLSDVFGEKGSQRLSVIGIALMCFVLAMLGLSWNGLGLLAKDVKILVVYLVLMGAGMGIFQSPNSNSIMGSVSHQHLGVASALLATIRNFGLVVGTAMSSSFLMYYYVQEYGTRISPLTIGESDQIFVKALRYTFFTLAAVSSGGILTSLAKTGIRRKHESKNRSRRG